ncbi:MAG: hypothetical protein DRG78_20830 [Epsilonproteobacteria bacterium]|nr:MAG: hypothetical protein DRG78_20830 [Campylobacterota bacterium]
MHIKPQLNGIIMKKSLLSLLILFLSVSLLQAQETSKAQVKKLVTNWLSIDAQPLNASMSSKITDITTYTNDLNETMYHIVSLTPDGFVVIAGDDMVEPIVAFVANGSYEDSLDNPMGALIKDDIPARVNYQRDLEEQRVATNSSYRSNTHSNKARVKWNYLENPNQTTIAKESSISNVYVAPLLQTKWNQKAESGRRACYNLYTPNNWPSGCVATAFAQVLRYFEYPKTPVGTKSYDYRIKEDDEYVVYSKNLMGGDGEGGVYEWSAMSYGPRIDDEESRKAIGRLMSDTGIVVYMRYSSSTSGAATYLIADALKDTFNYENTVYSFDIEKMTDKLNPNLDAGLPIILGIRGSKGGHAVITDGYGYNAETLYYHVNMGWGGSSNAWYNLPTVDDGRYNFTTITQIIYNIYPQGSGEIISGRVSDENGTAISGATVTASNGFSTTTNEKGIYALTRLPSNRKYTIEVTKSGYFFPSKNVKIGTSAYIRDGESVGNRWGIDFCYISDDKYEKNNLFRTAYNLTNSKNNWISGIQLDADWYKFYVEADAKSIKIDLRYIYENGAIKLKLSDSDKNVLIEDSSSDDNAYIEYELPHSFAGDYFYIKVSSKNSIGNSYRLLWNNDVKTMKKSFSINLISYLLN